MIVPNAAVRNIAEEHSSSRSACECQASNDLVETRMAKVKGSFGQLIRERRRQLGLTQQKVACRINVSTAYVGHLESGKRHPSDKLVLRIANVLGFDGRALYFLVNPGARKLLDERAQPSISSN